MAGRISYTIEQKGETGFYLTIRHGRKIVKEGPMWPNQDHKWPHDVYPDLDPNASYLTWEDLYNVFDYQKIKILILE